MSFRVDGFDKSKPMVIDPVLSFATYWGGSQYDAANGVAVDAQGNVLIAGVTDSTGYPTVNASYSNANVVGESAFIAKFNPAATTPGASVIFSTYFGGTNGGATAQALVLDPGGNIYLAGATAASDLPVSSNAYQNKPLTTSCLLVTINKVQQQYCGTGFVSKFSPLADHLLYSTYLGGEGYDFPYALAVDSKGNAYLAGQTYSRSFPTNNGYQTQLPGVGVGFLSELSPDGAFVLYSTYFGGENYDWITCVDVDRSGLVYVGGYTSSQHFPVTPSAYMTALKGPDNDAFLAKFDLTKSGQGIASV